MDRESPHDSRNARDTFLSRVFGLQSEDVGSSIHTEEMSNFAEERIDDEGSKLPESSNTTEAGGDTSEEEELRIPESDQGTTTEEEDAHSEDVDLNSTSFHNKMIKDGQRGRDGSAMDDSSVKIGQLSSDEEFDNDGADEVGADIPLFEVNKSKKKERIDRGSNLNNLSHSLLFRRILQQDKQKQKRQQLFTSSKDGYKRDGEVDSYKYDLENGFGARQKKQTWGDNIRDKGINSGRTNLFANISVLNNTPANRLNTLSPKERALWKWANVENLDVFLQDVYKYYLGNGYSCIVLEKLLNIATLIFIVFISTYMGHCINYSKLPSSNKLSDVTIEKCYSQQITGLSKLLLWMFYVFVALKVTQLYFDVQNLKDIHNFFKYLLDISDRELQTIPWQNVIQQVMYLKDQNALTANVVEVKAKNRMDAHDIANRIMRKENYLIAMYNNEVLDLSLPLPLYRTSTLTKTLEWNINLCIMGFAFNESAYIKQSFLKASQHEYLSEELRKRFMLAGFLNIILSPFLVAYFVLLYFFKYFNEYKTSPGSLGARQYTPMAEWKFREYNELYHLFQRRIGLSTELADRYINQFPKEGTNILLRFVAFISGSFVAVLALLTILDPENFLNFEVSSERTALFYITILGAVWTICRNSVSNDYNVFDPEETIQELATFTHYLPNDWEGKYHTEEVKNEFCKLYNLRIVILLRELASLIITPFILWFSLPKSTDKIVEFFRETSVYVDGLGYICKYAMFDVNLSQMRKKSHNHSSSLNLNHTQGKNGTTSASEEGDDQDSEDGSEEENGNAINKMMQSYLYFIDDYENSDNAVGKHQLPQKRYEDLKKAPVFCNAYSWKKQFQPGQKPELFKIGKHALERRSVQADGPVRAADGSNSKVMEPGRNLGESFINSLPARHHDRDISRERGSGPQGAGVLGLVKEFYKNQI